MCGRLILAALLLTCTSLVHAWEHQEDLRLPDIPPGAFHNNDLNTSHRLGEVCVQLWYARALVNPAGFVREVNDEVTTRLTAFHNIAWGFGTASQTSSREAFDVTAGNRLGLDVGYVTDAGLFLGGRISRLGASDYFSAKASSNAGDRFSISGDVNLSVTTLELLTGYHVHQGEGLLWSSRVSLLVGIGTGWASAGANAIQSVDIVNVYTETLHMAPEYKQSNNLVASFEFFGGMAYNNSATFFGGAGYQLAPFDNLRATHNFDYDGDGIAEIPYGTRLNSDLNMSAVYFKAGVGIFF